jgi:hypothetical protein
MMLSIKAGLRPFIQKKNRSYTQYRKQEWNRMAWLERNNILDRSRIQVCRLLSFKL